MCDIVLAYLRLSSDDDNQETESNSIQNQRLLIQLFLQKHYDLQQADVEFFVDDGYSGSNFNRPAFKRMMEKAKKASCCIVVKDLSRFGRDTIETQNYIEKVFPFLNIRFIAINDAYDSDVISSQGKDTEIKFKNLINGIYPQICSQNTKQAMRKLAEMGCFVGGTAPFGYQFDGEDKRKLIIDPEAAACVRQIFDKRLKGIKYSDIAKEFNMLGIPTPAVYLMGKGRYHGSTRCVPQWNGAKVRSIVENPIYTGTMIGHKTEESKLSQMPKKHIPKEQWIRVPGTHEAIVSQDEFDKVQPTVKRSRKCSYRNDLDFVLKRKIKCGCCGRAMEIKERQEKWMIRCTYASPQYTTECYPVFSPLSPIKDMVLKLVKQQALLADEAMRHIKEINKTLDIPKLKRQLNAYAIKIEKANYKKMADYERHIEGDISKEEFVVMKAQCDEQVKRYEARVLSLQKEIAEKEEIKARKNSLELKTFRKYSDINELTPAIVEELIKVIYFYDPEHIEIIWNYADGYMKEIAGNN